MTEETTMESSTTCEACKQSGELRPLVAFDNKDIAGAMCCRNCRCERASQVVYDDVRSNRRRSRPAAEPRDVNGAILRIGDVVELAQGCGLLYRVATIANGLVNVDCLPEGVRQDGNGYPGNRYRRRDTPAPQAGSGGIVEHLCPYDHETHRIYPGEHNKCASCGLTYAEAERRCVYPVDPKRQPEANPLRHLAEAFRELCECFCADCETICPPGRMVPMDELCVYCFHKATVKEPIASATPKEAERREVWDWDCEDVGYLP